jgi:hypothetical protein
MSRRLHLLAIQKLRVEGRNARLYGVNFVNFVGFELVRCARTRRLAAFAAFRRAPASLRAAQRGTSCAAELLRYARNDG